MRQKFSEHCFEAVDRALDKPPRPVRDWPDAGMVGLTGLEPVTLRLSSACSNQLSYTPESYFGLRIADCGLRIGRRGFFNPQSAICNRQSAIQIGGAEETRTPDL